MELELKHLAPYAPYELLVAVGNSIRNLTAISLDSPYAFVTAWKGSREKQMIGIENIQPFLRPLSDLTKEIEHKGERFVPIAELLKLAHPEWVEEKLGSRYSEIEYKHEGWYYKACFKLMATKDISIHSGFMWNIPYWISEKLYEWHFDWKDNLIEKGLAIDINTP